ncbi:MAG: hypothetical protein JXQ71_09020 [Verrucomicrobia bacterium]|nr:hypothetical protein [Verrucomicrobiota bacterium]
MPVRPASPSVYAIDANDFLTHVSSEWLAFAIENHAGHLTRERVIGTSLWSHIAEPTTRYFYRTLLQLVRTTHGTVSLPVRGDAPDLRRFMQIRLTHRGDGSVELECAVQSQEPRLAVSLLDPSIPRSPETVTMCSWCKKVATPEWVEVEEAVGILRLFEKSCPPQVVHGICESCQADLLAQLTQLTLPAPVTPEPPQTAASAEIAEAAEAEEVADDSVVPGSNPE